MNAILKNAANFYVNISQASIFLEMDNRDLDKRAA
jgi:hypothetical protein